MKFEKWSIWLANLEPVIGSEQGKTRPVIVISENQINEVLSVVNVLPLTSRKKNRNIYPNEALLPKKHSGLKSESVCSLLPNQNARQEAIDKIVWESKRYFTVGRNPKRTFISIRDIIHQGSLLNKSSSRQIPSITQTP